MNFRKFTIFFPKFTYLPRISFHVNLFIYLFIYLFIHLFMFFCFVLLFYILWQILITRFLFLFNILLKPFRKCLLLCYYLKLHTSFIQVTLCEICVNTGFLWPLFSQYGSEKKRVNSTIMIIREKIENFITTENFEKILNIRSKAFTLLLT